MFETNFSYASASVLPTTIYIDAALETLHDFETVIKLNPDCKGCKPIPPPKNGANKPNSNAAPGQEMQYYEVEDDLPFMPKKLWSGGVKYNADFLAMKDGCDITVHAPGSFTSTNHWRIVRESAPVASDHHLDGHPETIPEEDIANALTKVETKDLLHTESAGAGWYVQIISDARCPRTFAGIIKGFLKNSHAQLQHAFIDRLTQQVQRRATEAVSSDVTSDATKPERPKMTSRPTLGRRRSTHF